MTAYFHKRPVMLSILEWFGIVTSLLHIIIIKQVMICIIQIH